jgi:putative ABC transport system permease protein
MTVLFASLRRAARRLRRAPTYTATVTVSLALGIGVVAAVFALVDAVLLRPLPYPGAGRLVDVGHAAAVELAQDGLSSGTFAHYREHARVFDGIGVYVEHQMTLTGPGAPEQAGVAMVSPEVLPLLGVVPVVGRLPTGADAEPGAPQRVFISHEVWARRFARDPGVVGRELEVGRKRIEVAGVMPAGFHFPSPGTHVWLTWPQQADAAGVQSLYMSGVARLRPGVTPDAAERDLQRLVVTLPDAYGDVTAKQLEEMGLRARVVPLKELVVGDVRVPLLLLMGTAAFLLLITWANAVNLALVRAEGQRRTVAVERALGAPAGHLAGRFFSESVLLAAVGGALGLVLASRAIALRFGFTAEQLPRLEEVGTGAAVVGLVAALALLSAALLGAVAMARAVRGGMAGALAAGAGRSTAGRAERTGRAVLVAAQVALALTLLIGAALMARSFWKMKGVEPGFRAEGAMTFHTPVPATAYGSYHLTARVHHDVLERLRALPGVQSAEAVSLSGLPLTPVPDFWRNRFKPVGRAAQPGQEWPAAATSFATPGYFRSMGIPLLRGRTLEARDMSRTAPGVVLSASLASALFGDQDPVGRKVRWADMGGYPAYIVVGVVGDVAGQTVRDGPARTLYFPNVYPPAADTVTGAVLDLIPDEEVYVVRSTLPAASLVPAVRKIVQEVDSKLVIARVASLDEVVAASRAQARLTMVLLGVGAATALLLGAIGIYGILSYAVRQRTAELGVRMALGATPESVTRMVVRQGLTLALAGAAAGVAASLALTRFLGSLLYEVSPGDPLAFVAMATLLVGVAVVASYFPARRAGRIDPVQAIKGD